MPALYPAMVAAEEFQKGDCVCKIISNSQRSPFVGTVVQVIPATQKVVVQWPLENVHESPEMLVKVNPFIHGRPPLKDMGYSTYEKELADKRPLIITAKAKMAIRVAHTFATKIIGKLIDDINIHAENGLSDVQTYNRLFEKYGNICSDHIIRSSIEKVYEVK